MSVLSKLTVAIMLSAPACGAAPRVEPPPQPQPPPVVPQPQPAQIDPETDCFDTLPATALEVVTFNIHAGRDADIAQIGAAIRALDPDVVGLQEIDVGTRRTGRVDQPAVLRETTGLTVHFVKTLDYQGGSYGLGVGSRDSSVVTPLPLESGAEPRTLLVSSHEFEASPLVVATAHLDPPSDDDRQFDSLVAALKEHRPDVLLVDLNAMDDTPRYAALIQLGYVDAGALHPTSAKPTLLKDGAETRIDFVFVGPDFEPVCAEVIDTRLSDHRAVRAAIVRK